MPADPVRAPVDSLLSRARRLWTDLAGVPVEFPPPGQVNLVVSARSRLCEPGWAGVVVLGGAGIATAPDAATANRLSAALRAVPLDALADRGGAFSAMPGLVAAGSSTLSYLDAADFRPAPTPTPVVELPVGHDGVRALLGSVTPTEVAVSGLRSIASPAFVVHAGGAGGAVAAAAGYRLWPQDVAHLNVLVGREHRRRGLGRVVSSAATAHALSRGLLPQARTHPISLRLFDALGFRLLGFQVSLLLPGADRPDVPPGP